MGLVHRDPFLRMTDWHKQCGPAVSDATAALGGANMGHQEQVSTTLEKEAIATVENEATQTDWMGDLSGGLGFDSAAGRGRCSAASGREGSGCWEVDGRAGVGLGSAAEV